ncbi:archease [Candidatus Bathyarchaeota archaeon]|nr:MAG: archease [Candidatus Bathyarchaeota archaeon]
MGNLREIFEMAEHGGFRFLEHTADVYVVAHGKDMSEAFENAARAMFETMTNIKEVKPVVQEHVEVEGRDEKELLYNWLEELLIRFDINGRLYSKFHVEEIRRTSQGYRLKAQIYGEEFDSSRHLQKVGVKAITYHRMEIKKTDGVTLKFILDI